MYREGRKFKFLYQLNLTDRTGILHVDNDLRNEHEPLLFSKSKHLYKAKLILEKFLEYLYERFAPTKQCRIGLIFTGRIVSTKTNKIPQFFQKNIYTVEVRIK